MDFVEVGSMETLNMKKSIVENVIIQEESVEHEEALMENTDKGGNVGQVKDENFEDSG